MAWEFSSKEDVMALHPIQQSELRDEWSTMVESLIRDHLGQPYLGVTQVIENEYYNGDGTYMLRVRKPPIASVQQVLVNDVTLTASDYVVFDDHISLKSQVFPLGTLNVRLYYTSGDTNISPTISLAAAAMIVAIINYRRKAGADSSLKWGEAEPRVGEATPNQIGLTSHLIRIMRQLLKRPRLMAR